MRITGLYILIITSLMCCSPIDDIPEAEISNGIISASLYLPDADIGYYRATRFDWSGVISSLEYNGHTFFGKWLDTYDPTAHNSIMGPVDYFEPLNYDEAENGGSFVKIGVGTLKKTTEEPFYSFTTFPIIDPGEWTINKEAAKIQFIHVLNDKVYPYEYTKTITLLEGKPEMTISYNLKNTGQRVIITQVFNHNFFVFDKQAVGEGYELTFQKNISCSGKNHGFGELAEIKENKLKILQSLANDSSVYCASIDGISNNATDFNIDIYSKRSGIGVRLIGDQPISTLAFWSRGVTICPEAYVKIKIEPGKDVSWENTYEFYVDDGSQE